MRKESYKHIIVPYPKVNQVAMVEIKHVHNHDHGSCIKIQLKMDATDVNSNEFKLEINSKTNHASKWIRI